MNRHHLSRARTALAASGLVALLLAAVACGGGRPDGEPLLTTRAGDLAWNLWLDPNPPRQQGNTLWVEVEDAAGEPLEDARVAVSYLMPAMGAMAEMRGSGEVSNAGEGLYRAALDFPMGGTWTLTLTVATGAGEAAGEYTLTVGTAGLRQTGMTGGGSRAAGTAGQAPAMQLPPLDLPPASREALRTALAAYEEARQLLATDELEGLQPRAARLAQSLELARQGLEEQPMGEEAESTVARSLAEAAVAARALGEAGSLEHARQAFGEVSRFLVLLAGSDPQLAAGWHVFECPMTGGFPKWMQPSSELANPYMGTRMLTCGSESDWAVPAPVTLPEIEAHAEAVHGGDIAYYTCSMHPSVRQPEPGRCPICSMDLTPVTREEVESGVIRVDEGRRQQIGVRTAPVTVRPVEVTIRAVGTVTYDETALSAVSLKYEGWIDRLFVEETGQPVRRGQPLFTLYSPALVAAQEELLTALASQRAARSTDFPDRADYLVDAARRRLTLWDLTPRQIEEIAAGGEAVQHITVYSPASGFVVEKNVVEGEAVGPGRTLFRIAGLERVWVDAEVYESELPLVRRGQPAEVTFPYLPGKRFAGKVDYIYPFLQSATRTGRVRVVLPNPGHELKPEMYANVVLATGAGERVMVPEEAVIYAGPRRLVFVDLGEGRLQPREIEVGIKAGDAYEVLSGLEPGEVVVTSGNFLIAAESRLKSATERW